VLYFDTSFLAPLILPEATSDKIAAFLRRLPYAELTVSHWTRVEFSSLIAREVRMGRLDVQAAARADARLVVIDMVVPDGDAQDRATMVEILMLGMVGGRQRSLSEWRHLLARGGFALERVVTGSGSYCALEAKVA